MSHALEELSEVDPSAAQIVKLRYFTGLSMDDTSQAMGISRATAYRQWVYAKAWLHKTITQDANS